ncbi:MAG: hypothetical protein KDA94_17105 [Acidimicrobiales bacterium]|nr:hypothetical protein [Acidimicrobiales bacterium]
MSKVAQSQHSEDLVELSSRLTELAKRIALANGRQVEEPVHEPVEAAREIDHQGRIWPQMPDVPPAYETDVVEPPSRKTSSPKKAPEPFDSHDLQIAELTGRHLAQEEDLRAALDQIDLLIATIDRLQQDGANRDRELATTSQKLIQKENECFDLHQKLETERQKNNSLAQRVLTVETAFNDKLVGITADRENVDRLKDELTLTVAETRRVVAAAEVRAHRLFSTQIESLKERHEQQDQEFKLSLAERDEKIIALEAENAARCSALSDQIAALVTEKDRAKEALQKQLEQIAYLETVAKVERENAEATVKEVIAEFARERDALIAREKKADEIRKNIVQLLPRLTLRRDSSGETPAQVA